MRFDLKGRIAVVTGGEGLLGKEFVKTLKEAGAVVISVDEKIKEVSRNKMKANVSDENAARMLVEYIFRDKGKVDILVNSAAINPSPNDFRDCWDIENWRKMIDVNLTGTFLCCREFGRRMVEQDTGGVIVNIASELGIIAPDQRIYDGDYVKPPAYGVSKAGVINLTKWLTTLWRGKVRANTLVPCGIENNQDEKFIRKFSNTIPLGRMSQKHEFNEALLFLCSNASSYMAGQTLVCDGGRTIW